MKKRKLNYRFHNPNTAEVTADYLLLPQCLDYEKEKT